MLPHLFIICVKSALVAYFYQPQKLQTVFIRRFPIAIYIETTYIANSRTFTLRTSLNYVRIGHIVDVVVDATELPMSDSKEKDTYAMMP